MLRNLHFGRTPKFVQYDTWLVTRKTRLRKEWNLERKRYKINVTLHACRDNVTNIDLQAGKRHRLYVNRQTCRDMKKILLIFVFIIM